MDPYAPPSARVEELGPRDAKRSRPPARPDQRRPFLVWITQAQVAWYIVSVPLGFFLGLRGGGPLHVSVGTLVLRLSLFAAAILVPLGILFYGLTKARRWSWHGSIVLAVATLIFYAIPAFFTPPDQVHFASQTQRAVVMSIRLAWTCLLTVYLIALFTSAKVRGFLGVDRPGKG